MVEFGKPPRLMQDHDNKAFFRAAQRLRQGRVLSSTDAMPLVDRVFLPVVKKRHKWVASYLGETFDGNKSGAIQDLAFTLAGELWEDISRMDLWEKWWQDEAIQLPDQIPGSSGGADDFDKKIVRLRNLAVGRVDFLFRDRARRRTIRRPLLKLVRDGHFALSDSQKPNNADYFPKSGETLPPLPKETALDVRHFQFPLPKGGRIATSTGQKESATKSPVRTKVNELPLQIPSGKELKPLLNHIFQRYPYQIPFSELVNFLNEGYGISADIAFAEDSASPSESPQANTPVWLTDLEQQELLMEVAEKIASKVIPKGETNKLPSKVETFLYFSIWNGLETVDGETYGLEVYAERYSVPKSTASEHTVKFIKPLLEDFIPPANSRRKPSQLSPSAAPVLLQLLRQRFIQFKPEFVIWEPLKEDNMEFEPK